MAARSVTARLGLSLISSRTACARSAIVSGKHATALNQPIRTFRYGLAIEDRQFRMLDHEYDRWKTVPHLWLRDNCHCPSCLNKETMQREVDIFELPMDLKPLKVTEHESKVEVLWSDDHISIHNWRSLKSAFLKGKTRTAMREAGRQRTVWTSAIEAAPREVGYDRVMNGDGMAQLTKDILEYGFCFVVDTPVTPEATKALLERIGPIRNTHYGGFYDFIPDQAMADTAYTNIALPAHTDTTYFSEPAGLQAFHMLSHEPPPDHEPEDGDLGGKSLLVDGLRAAEILKSRHANYYHTLRTVRMPWHASGNEGISITPGLTAPVIRTRLGSDGKKHIIQIRWNESDRGVVPLGLHNVKDLDWYNAARKFDSILKQEESQYWFQLQPGRVVIFDNWRVLHGRSEFKGLRRICGGYINRDDFLSRWKMSNFAYKTVINNNLWQTHNDI